MDLGVKSWWGHGEPSPCHSFSILLLPALSFLSPLICWVTQAVKVNLAAQQTEGICPQVQGCPLPFIKDDSTLSSQLLWRSDRGETSHHG